MGLSVSASVRAGISAARARSRNLWPHAHSNASTRQSSLQAGHGIDRNCRLARLVIFPRSKFVTKNGKTARCGKHRRAATASAEPALKRCFGHACNLNGCDYITAFDKCNKFFNLILCRMTRREKDQERSDSCLEITEKKACV